MPAWPKKPVLGGVPEVVAGEKTGRVLLTQDGLAELARYQAEVLGWSRQALLCIGVPQP